MNSWWDSDFLNATFTTLKAINNNLYHKNCG
jgi:hypothetical protein